MPINFTVKNQKAFTLLELLVVVLIIGILAALALPQYEKAVQKSRVAAILPLMRSVDSAQQIYKLSTGSYAQTFDDLVLEMPAGGTKSGTTTLSYAKYSCFICQSCNSVYCITSTGLMIEKYYTQRSFICWAPKDNNKLIEVCRTFGVSSGTDATGRYNGTGSNYGYSFY